MAQAQPRFSTRIPERRSIAVHNHSVSQSGLAPPLVPAIIHSGWYARERGKRLLVSRGSMLALRLQSVRLLVSYSFLND